MHPFRNKKEITRKKRLTKIAFILVLFLIISLSGFFGFFSKFLNYIGQPIWQSKKVIVNELDGLNYLSKSKKDLIVEIQNLNQENSNLKFSMIDYQIVKNENEKLKKIIGRTPLGYDFVLATVLVKPNHSPYDTLIIDVGQENGIKEGLVVYINGNIPIGIVDKVYQKTSLVELYSNPSKVTEGVIEESNIAVELIGRGGGNFEMKIPLEVSSNKGSLIVLPSLQSEVLAILEEDISDPTDPIKKIILRSPVNVQNEKWVQVKIN